MTDLLELPHAGLLVIGHLLADDDVTDLVGEEVVTDMNADRLPAIRVTQFPGRMVSGSSIYWLTESLLQVDCYWSGGSDRKHARDLASVAHRSLAQMRGAVTYTVGTDTVTGVVSGVELFGIADASDDRFQPAKPFSRFDLLVTAHPLPPSGS